MKRTNKRLRHIVEQAVNDSFRNGKIEQEKINHFVKYFTSVPSKVLAIELLELFLHTLKLRLSEGELIIHSAVELSKTQATAIEDFIKKDHIVYNTRIATNPNLIGGIKVQIGDKVYENSIDKQISQIGQIIHG